MISGYVFNEKFDEALDLFDILKSADVKLTQVSVVSALSAATEIGNFERGVDIHRYVIDKKMRCDLSTMTMLVSLYARCGDTEKARVIFDEMQLKDVVAWSAMISGLTQSNQPGKAISLFHEMQSAGVRPNGVTIAGVLPACADLQDLKIGKCIHGLVLRYEVVLDALVGTALVAMYAKLGDFASAHSVFNYLRHKVVITWNAMISGYAHSGDADNALRIFHQLLGTGQFPDRGTMVGAVSACTLLNAIRTGECIHGMTIKHGLESDIHVCNALIDMYAKGCDISSSQFLFNRSRGNVISWNTMIAGYMHNGFAREAISFFHQMRFENVKPNVVTFVSILPAAAYLASLKEGQTLHSYVVRTGFESHVQIANSLIDMYSKCGRVDVARNFFNNMDNRDTVTWNSMLAGYAIHGHAEKALALFSDMKDSGVIADSLSFLSVLSACRHGGLVSEGQNLFNSMGSGHHPRPNLEHYACMVDLFGRAGLLNEAWCMIQSMPLEPDVAVWGALLGACRTHSNLSLAEIAADRLITLEPNNPAHYVVLSNIYLHSRRWADAGQIRKALSTTGLIKKPGCSWVEIKNTLHAFRAGDQSHPQFESMHALWYELHEKMRKMGYVPDTNLVLHNVEEEEKESFLNGHSERMAITFAILNTEPGREIQIVKNLRVCGDCHIITKLISKITKRRIVVRDSSRFHHFESGFCSCKDYW